MRTFTIFPPNEIDGRINELLERYDLKNVADAKPESLPLGVKQRLQLAVAVLHRPPMLILDEPTSGVDPVARDAFWRTLIDLSRNDGVTIFLSTHFMNEAERCDRISLMHAGKVLAVGAPTELVKQRGSASLEDAFISYLEEAGGAEKEKKVAPPQPARIAGETRGIARDIRCIAHFQAIRSRTAMGLCPARDHGAPARSLPDRIRVRRSCHSDAGLRLRHYVRCREPEIRGLRPGPDAAKPPAARKLLGIALFHRTASDQLPSGTGATHAERRAGCRGRNPSRLRPRSGKPAFARGRLLGGRLHAVPRRDDQRIRQRLAAALRAGSRRSSVSAPTRHPTSMSAASISKIASATTRLSRASSPWFRPSS